MLCDWVPDPDGTATPPAMAVMSGFANTDTLTPSMTTLVGVPMAGGVVSRVTVVGADALDDVPPSDCTAVTVQEPSLGMPERAHSPVLEASEAFAGGPAISVHVTDSEPRVAVTTTLAPGMRSETLMTGDESLVMPSLLDAPESDDGFRLTEGGAMMVHVRVPVDVLPARSVAV